METESEVFVDRELEFIQLLANAPPPTAQCALCLLVAYQHDAWVAHERGRVIAASTELARAAGYERGDELVGVMLCDRLPPPTAAVCRAQAMTHGECPYHLAPGSSLYEVRPRVLRLDGRVLRVLCLLPVARLAGVEWLACRGGVSRLSVSSVAQA